MLQIEVHKMGEIITMNSKGETGIEAKDIFANEHQIHELTEEMLVAARSDIERASTLKLPIAELTALGTTVSSLLPAFRTIATDGSGLIV